MQENDARNTTAIFITLKTQKSGRYKKLLNFDLSQTWPPLGARELQKLNVYNSGAKIVCLWVA